MISAKKFQFTPLREGRPTTSCAVTRRTNFNSRPCGRGDRAALTWAPCNLYFNSRPCGRGDTAAQTATIHGCVFQFTPLREGRQLYGRVLEPALEISIHAPAGGATRCARPGSAARQRFQFTPLREGRHRTRQAVYKDMNFNSRPCGRGDLYIANERGECHVYFNSRPCGRGDP